MHGPFYPCGMFVCIAGGLSLPCFAVSLWTADTGGGVMLGHIYMHICLYMYIYWFRLCVKPLGIGLAITGAILTPLHAPKHMYTMPRLGRNTTPCTTT